MRGREADSGQTYFSQRYRIRTMRRIILPMDNEKARKCLHKKSLYELKEQLLIINREYGAVLRKKELVEEEIERRRVI